MSNTSEAHATLSLNASGFVSALNAAEGKLMSFTQKAAQAFGRNVVAQAAALTGGVMAVGAAFDQMRASLNKGVELNSQLEQVKLSISTLLGQFDSTSFADFNERAEESSRILEVLRQKGLVAEATFQDLAQAYQMTAGNMFSAGITNADKQIDMIVAVSQALAAYGGDQAMLSSEINSLLTGNVNAWHRVARGIGMTGAELRKAQDDGKLFGVVMERLGPIIADSEQGMGTLSSRLTMNKELIEKLQATLAEPMFEAIREELEGINDALDSDTLTDSMKAIADNIAAATRYAMKMAAVILENFPAILASAKSLSQVMIPLLVAMAAKPILASKAWQNLLQSIASLQVMASTELLKLKTELTVHIPLALQNLQLQVQRTGFTFGTMAGIAKSAAASIAVTFKSLGAALRAEFASLKASGLLAMLGMQAAIAAVIVVYGALMNKVQRINEAINDSIEISKRSVKEQANVSEMVRGHRMTSGGKIVESDKGLTSAEDRDAVMEEETEKWKQLKEDLQKLKQETKHGVGYYRNSDNALMSGPGEGIREEIWWADGADVKISALEQAIAGAERNIEQLSRMGDAEFAKNKEIAKLVALRREQAKLVEQFDERRDAANKAFEEKTKDAAQDEITDPTAKGNFAIQRANIFGVTDRDSMKGREQQLEAMVAINKATAAEKQELLKIKELKVQILEIDLKAKKQADEAQRLREREAENAAIAEAQIAGDDKKAKELKRAQERADAIRQISEENPTMSLAEVGSLVDRRTALQDKLEAVKQGHDRDSFESELDILRLRKQGREEEAKAKEMAAKTAELTKRLIGMGYGEKEAARLAQERVALENQPEQRERRGPTIQRLASIGGNAFVRELRLDPFTAEQKRTTEAARGTKDAVTTLNNTLAKGVTIKGMPGALTFGFA